MVSRFHDPIERVSSTCSSSPSITSCGFWPLTMRTSSSGNLSASSLINSFTCGYACNFHLHTSRRAWAIRCVTAISVQQPLHSPIRGSSAPIVSASWSQEGHISAPLKPSSLHSSLPGIKDSDTDAAQRRSTKQYSLLSIPMVRKTVVPTKINREFVTDKGFFSRK